MLYGESTFGGGGLAFQTVTPNCPQGAPPPDLPTYPDTAWAQYTGTRGLGRVHRIRRTRYGNVWGGSMWEPSRRDPRRNILGFQGLGQLTWANVVRSIVGSSELNKIISTVNDLQGQLPKLIESEAQLRKSMDEYNESVKAAPESCKVAAFPGPFGIQIPNPCYFTFAGTRAKLDHGTLDFAANLYLLQMSSLGLLQLGEGLFSAGLVDEAEIINSLNNSVNRLTTQSRVDLDPRSAGKYTQYLAKSRDVFLEELKLWNVGSTDRLNSSWWGALGKSYEKATGKKLSGLSGLRGRLGALGLDPLTITLILSIVKLLLVVIGIIALVHGAVSVVGQWTGAARTVAATALEHEKRLSSIQADTSLTQAQKDAAKAQDTANFETAMKETQNALDKAKPKSPFEIPWYVWVFGGLGVAAVAGPPLLRKLRGKK